MRRCVLHATASANTGGWATVNLVLQVWGNSRGRREHGALGAAGGDAQQSGGNVARPWRLRKDSLLKMVQPAAGLPSTGPAVGAKDKSWRAQLWAVGLAAAAQAWLSHFCYRLLEFIYLFT